MYLRITIHHEVGTDYKKLIEIILIINYENYTK